MRKHTPLRRRTQRDCPGLSPGLSFGELSVDDFSLPLEFTALRCWISDVVGQELQSYFFTA